MSDNIPETIMLIFAILFIGLLGWLFVELLKEEQRRHEWLSAHCKIIGKMSGSLGNSVGVGSDGSPTIGIVSIPGKTGYQCDDGKQYWE